MPFESLIFKTIGDVKLEMRIFSPPNADKKKAARAGILFFVCGSWNGFDLAACAAQCTYFASRGAVCFATQVRVEPVHGTTPAECVIDAKSAVRWVRAHAAAYGVDPNKLVTCGGSAAGHVSACTALIDDYNDPADDLKVSAKPNAVTIFCPVLVGYHSQGRVNRFGGPDPARALSPILHVSKAAPPFLIQFGAADEVVFPEEGTLFKRELDRLGVRCDLKIYHQEGHGFHSYYDGKNPMFFIGFRTMDKFLCSLDFLQGAPTIDQFQFVSPQAG